ncbi:MAG: hypothetical protein HUU20_29475, partial [Pirellulales bacterium]|nr:hypothetical protein [Pirellulales bacterium]
MAKYFDVAALRTFAQALVGILGLAESGLQFVFRGRAACTDGKTVVLPAAGTWEAPRFSDLCGLVLHELGHVYFNSPAFHKEIVDSYPASKRPLAAMAVNAVLDVADETRIIRRFPAGERLLAGLAESALE